MTKQEEIREEIKEFVLEIRQYLCNTEFAPEPFTGVVDPNVLLNKLPDKILSYLHSQGVVIKVDRELPKRDWHEDWGGESGKAGYELALEDMAGYVAVKPLVEE